MTVVFFFLLSQSYGMLKTTFVDSNLSSIWFIGSLESQAENT